MFIKKLEFEKSEKRKNKSDEILNNFHVLIILAAEKLYTFGHIRCHPSM